MPLLSLTIQFSAFDDNCVLLSTILQHYIADKLCMFSWDRIRHPYKAGKPQQVETLFAYVIVYES